MQRIFRLVVFASSFSPFFDNVIKFERFSAFPDEKVWFSKKFLYKHVRKVFHHQYFGSLLLSHPKTSTIKRQLNTDSKTKKKL